MSTESPTLAQRLAARFGDKIAAVHEWRGEVGIDVAPANWLAVAQALRDDEEFHFEQLIDVSGVDYLSYGQTEWDTTDVSATGFSRGVEGESAGRFNWADRPHARVGHKRFAAVVQLLSVRNNQRLRLRGYCEDDALPMIASLTHLWPVANWFEREAFDLYGIIFEGHPDLRRILTDYGFVGHPFRKDFPVSGHVEMRYDPEQKRVIYQPVTIEPREITPRIIREENYADEPGFRKG